MIKEYVKGALAALVAAAIISVSLYIVSLRHDNQVLQKNNTAQAAVNVTLLMKLEAQNESITLLGKEHAKRLEEGQAMVAQAKVQRAKAELHAQRLYAAKPSTPADPCKSALDLINGASTP